MIGILVDVSGSMKNSVGGRVEEEGGRWAKSIFKVVDELIKHDVSSSNQTFALALGSPFYPEVFDLLSTVSKASQERASIEDIRSRASKRDVIDEALTILERNGATRVRHWLKMDVLLKVIDDTTAAAILYYLQRSSNFTTKFVQECLPRGFHGLLRGTEDLVRDMIEKGKQLVAETRKAEMIVGVSKDAIISVHNASEILHASIGGQELTNEQANELLKAVEPFIYGGTPLIQAMRHSVDLFSYPEFANHQKLLFILSDGQPADGNDPPLQNLSNLGVTIVSCFITNQSLSDPRHLYSILDESWEKPAKTMFRMSSTITTQMIPRTLFLKRGWKIDIDNNETRLFFQVNHPEIIKDVCDMAKNGVLSQDALSDMLSTVDLDIYINKSSDEFGAKRQH